MGKICLNFTITLVLTMIALIIISGLLAAYAGFDAGSGTSFIPAMVGAMFAGQRHAARTKTMPLSNFSWRAAIWMTAITVVFGIVLIAIMVFVLPSTLGAELQSIPLGVLAGVLVVVALIQFLAIRFFFGMGAKQTIKTLDRQVRETF